jgi:hypothetical protein
MDRLAVYMSLRDTTVDDATEADLRFCVEEADAAGDAQIATLARRLLERCVGPGA